jgi:pSer/pThr/pTyr-binding forkhead associated (FHA) protein
MNSSGILSLIVQKGLANEQVINLEAPAMVIGRMAPADIILDNKVVSRQHARITLEEGQCFLEDLKSLNGTFVNGNPIKGKVPLKSGDRISLGDQVLMVLQEKLLQSEPSSLEVTISGSGTNRFPLGSDRTTIGRANDNDIVIPSGIVSRHHAHLEFVEAIITWKSSLAPPISCSLTTNQVSGGSFCTIGMKSGWKARAMSLLWR